jgi:hypothetical protein
VLDAVSCSDDNHCSAGGLSGVIVATTDGTTWTQQANALGGSVSTLASDPYDDLTVLSASCTTGRCVFGTGDDGDILTTPVPTVTVTVAASDSYGNGQSTLSLAATSPEISYTPSSEAANVTGTLTCSTNATATSNVGSYTVSGCSGLSDSGHTIGYDEADSTYTITKADQTITFPAIADTTSGAPAIDLTASASSGLPVTFAAQGSCSLAGNGTTLNLTGTGACTVSANQPGDPNHNAAPTVARSFTIRPATPRVTLTTTPAGSVPYGAAKYRVAVTATGLATQPTGKVTISDGTRSCSVTLSATAGACSLAEPVGTYSVTASYAGDSSYAAAKKTITEKVVKAAPKLSIKTHIKGHRGGRDIVTVTLSVIGVPAGQKPTGKAQITASGQTCGKQKLNAHGQISCTLKEKHGKVTLLGRYAGNSTYKPAQAKKTSHT